MPLQRRVPKFGFNNINRKEYQGINLDTIQMLVDNKKIKSTLDFNNIVELRLARKNELVKILGRGELKTKLKIN